MGPESYGFGGSKGSIGDFLVLISYKHLINE